MKIQRINKGNKYAFNEKIKNSLRIKHYRTDLNYQRNEYLRNREYKKKMRKNFIFKRRELSLNFNRLHYLRLNDENYKIREHKNNLIRMKIIRQQKLEKKQCRRQKNNNAVKLIRQNKRIYKKQQKLRNLMHSLNCNTNSVASTNEEDPYNLLNRPEFMKKIDNYTKAIEDGPTCICSCCGGRFFKKSVTFLTEASIKNHKTSLLIGMKCAK